MACKVYHYSPSITRRDAIGYSLSFLHKALLARGVASYLVCDSNVVAAAPPFTLSFEDFVRRRPGRDDLIIFHYSFLDRNADAMMALPCAKILVYHNITPGHFFRDHGQAALGDACDAGRAYLPQMNRSFAAVVADSAYNAAELLAAGFAEPKVVPVFYNGGFYADGHVDQNDFLHRRLEDATSMVFIGRFVPNKRPDNVIRVAACVKAMSGRAVRLRFHGKVWDAAYFHQLKQLIAEQGLEYDVSFEINQPQHALRTSLASADAFVSMSEHEGFMVPLLEAFSAGCPVVALRSSAVTETCGPAGCLVPDADPELMAGHIIALARERRLRSDIIRGQSARAHDFAASRTLNSWMNVLQPFLPKPVVDHARSL